MTAYLGEPVTARVEAATLRATIPSNPDLLWPSRNHSVTIVERLRSIYVVMAPETPLAAKRYTGLVDKIAVILGAGAAHDVSNESRAVNPQFQPPLVEELFGDGARDHFSDIMDRYEGAGLLYDELFGLAKAGRLDLEAKLQEYASDEAPPTIARAFRYIPPYIRDVLAESGRVYGSNLGTYTQLVLMLLAHQPHQIAFIVMNYDDLLERALRRYDAPNFSFESLPDYVQGERQAQVYKLHGSTN